MHKQGQLRKCLAVGGLGQLEYVRFILIIVCHNRLSLERINVRSFESCPSKANGWFFILVPPTYVTHLESCRPKRRLTKSTRRSKLPPKSPHRLCPRHQLLLEKFIVAFCRVLSSSSKDCGGNLNPNVSKKRGQ